MKSRSSSQRKASPTPRSSGQQQQAASGAGKQYGEGNYKATRDYNAGLKKHLEGADVEREARDAAPRNDREEREMDEAERIGRRPARGNDSVEGAGKGPDSDADLQK
jgi:hypothetical protein